MVDLFEEGDEEGAPSPFADASALSSRPKIGRPAGARNRHSVAFEAYYYRKGYRDPLTAAAQIISEDPVALLNWFKEHDPKGSKKLSLVAVVKLQLEAGRDVAPYLHGKAPARVAQEGEQLPYLVINARTNELAQANKLLAGKALTIGSKINDLESEE